MTIRTTLIALSALGLSAIAVVPASADSLTLRFSDHGAGITLSNGYGYGPGWGNHGPRHRNEWQRQRISAREAYREVRQRGFDDIRLLDERRDSYVFRARGHRGHTVRVVVDARDGDVTVIRNRRR
ncbi:MAG TPA: hypothetical protein PLG99_05140 [Kaistiaceae bacterium]|nr:hypothetical protein [Kaistiaceae bacterium]